MQLKKTWWLCSHCVLLCSTMLTSQIGAIVLKIIMCQGLSLLEILISRVTSANSGYSVNYVVLMLDCSYICHQKDHESTIVHTHNVGVNACTTHSLDCKEFSCILIYHTQLLVSPQASQRMASLMRLWLCNWAVTWSCHVGSLGHLILM